MFAHSKAEKRDKYRGRPYTARQAERHCLLCLALDVFRLFRSVDYKMAPVGDMIHD
jgi:hypothetical protein